MTAGFADAAASRGVAANARAQRPSTAWGLRYAGRLVCSDVVIVALTLAAFWGLRVSDVSLDWPGGPSLSYAIPLGVIGALWLFCLYAFGTREKLIVGHGVTEYRRIISATVFMFTIVVSVGFFLRIEITRSLLLVAMPLGLIVLLLGRWTWRQWLRRRQHAGDFVFRAIVLGERAKMEHIAHQIQRARSSGYMIVGAVTLDDSLEPLGKVPVLGGFDDTVRVIEETGADTLIFGGSDKLNPREMRRLGWMMADRDVNWVVSPALTDVAGPRIHARPVAGLPLVHVDFPRLEGYRRFAKRAFDIIMGAVLLVITLPVMLIAAIAILIEGPGPLIYTQKRVGRHSREFSIIKFRSMVEGADDQLASLLDLQETSKKPFFKVTNDPRITRVGHFMRRHSIDELPQLINVLSGRMSLVGPRPQRPDEVALYDNDVQRRLLVKPGMSGLWQVSGRSKLSTNDAIRFDLYYVENWSFAQDLQILFRTVKAVIAPGASAH